MKHYIHLYAMNMLMRTMKFHANKSIDRSIDRNILFNRNGIHAIHLAVFAIRSQCVPVCCSFFKMFHIFIATISFLLSFRNVLSLLPFSIFIMSIPLRLLMSFDICTYYCVGHKYVATLCLDVNTISPIHILHYK